MNMDIKTIKTFRTIVKHRNFQKAAEELAYAQSTVTMQIKKLEDELGTRLLERGKQGFHLTEAGLYLYEQAELLLDEVEKLQEGIEHIRTGEAGYIRLGVMEPYASYRLPALLKPFVTRYPRVNLSVQIQSNQALGNMVQQGELDIAICTLPDDLSGLHYEKLLVEEIALLIPQDHPFAAEQEISLSMLQEEPLLITSPVCPFRKSLEKAMSDKGLRPRYHMEVSNMLAVKHYVSAGYGIAAIPTVAAEPLPPGCLLRPLHGVQLGIEISLVYPRQFPNRRKSVRELLDTLRSGAEKQETSIFLK